MTDSEKVMEKEFPGIKFYPMKYALGEDPSLFHMKEYPEFFLSIIRKYIKMFIKSFQSIN